MMEFYAAIDLRQGRAVRLLKGDFAAETNYGDPMELAETFIEGGSDWLHIVDLDGARDEAGMNRSIIQSIASMSPIPIETGGGIRTERDVEELLSFGVQRVILGTLAMEDPSRALSLMELFPGHVGIGLDYRNTRDGGEVAVRGWEQGSGHSLIESIDRCSSDATAALVVTAIDRDGTLEGPDFAGLQRVMDATALPVIASGGVGDLDDLKTLTTSKVAGVVVGKALVEERFTVAEGVRACR
jgi:phosphoribosylformimino-5-aminoimidazole carboxamide ribotide isomerase